MSPSAEAPSTAPGGPAAASGDVLLEVRHLVKHFAVGGGFFGGPAGLVRAVDDVSFAIRRDRKSVV